MCTFCTGKDKDAYREGTDVEKKLYEAAILQFRQDNKNLRKEVKARENVSAKWNERANSTPRLSLDPLTPSPHYP